MSKSVQNIAQVARTVSAGAAPLRVLVVLPAGAGPAAFIFVRRQLQQFVANGIELSIFEFANRLSLIGVWRSCVKLGQQAREFNADLVHAQYGTITAFVAAVGAPSPLVITFRGSDLNGDPGLSWWRNAIGKLLSQVAVLRASAVICVSEQLRDSLWWKRGRTDVIPSGVDLDCFRPEPRAQARLRLGWLPDERVVMYNVHPPLLKGAALARAAVEYAVAEVGPIRSIELRGDIEPEMMPNYLNACDCVLLTSMREGSPNLVKEALACNVPVIAVAVGDVAQRLRGVSPSYVCPRRDPRELGAALAEILRNPQRCNGRQAVLQLGCETVTERILEVYHCLRRS